MNEGGSTMPDWWEGFFEGLFQDVQLGVGTEDDNRTAVDKMLRVLGLQGRARILDAPCGGGRISLELAARGHDVTGVDITERFVAEARRRAGERGLAIRWERGDIRDLWFESEFEAVLNFGGSFGYFGEEDNARVVGGMYRALAPGGRLLIDAPTPETVFPRFREQLWSTTGDLIALTRNRYDHETGRVEGDWTVVAPDGRRETLRSSIRLYTYRELAGMVRAAGFTRAQGFDAEDLEPFALGASRLWLVAEKGRSDDA
jgi:SAM-dependent methyltransferase